MGGLVRRATMIKRWRKERSNLLVLDAGDLFYPAFSTPPSGDRKAVMNLKAEAIVAAFDHLGADAITIGESDLLWGKGNLLEILKRAEFPVVSANLIDTGSGNLLLQPYVIKQVQGLRVGIFGLFPKSQGNTDSRLDGLTVLEPSDVAHQVVSTLKKKTDFVILLSHLGYAKDLELTRRVEGINVIVGGHNGNNLHLPRVMQNTAVLQVGNKGRYLGRVDLKIKNPTRSFVNLRTREILRKRLQRIEAQLEAQREIPHNSAENLKRRKALERQKAETERILKLYEGHNEMVNRIVSLTDEIPPDGECERILQPYLLQIAEAENSSPPDPSKT